MGWAIELLRDGSNLREHESRFEPGGKYSTMPMGSYAVLDFRSHSSSQPKHLSFATSNTHLVVFSSDYGQATLHHNGLQWKMKLSD